MNVRDIVRRVFTTRYTRGLEIEVARLRAENRALLNSILGIAGIPPVVVSSDVAAGNAGAESTSSGHMGVPAHGVPLGPSRRKMPERNPSRLQQMTGVPLPVRHRSWQQVNRMLELEAVRKSDHSISHKRDS